MTTARGDRALTIALLCLILTQVAEFWLMRWFAGVFFAIYAAIAGFWYWLGEKGGGA